MRLLRLLAICLPLLAPASALAFGFTLSAGAGYLTDQQQMKAAAQLTPFHRASIFQFELPIEFQLVPERQFALGPGLKVFLPDSGAYVRAAYMLGNLGSDLSQTAVVGVGWQRQFLDTFGFLVEVTGEPRIHPGNGLALMGRTGLFISF